MVPPCAATIDRRMARPIPIPPSLVVKKLSNRRSISSSAMPGPLSQIEKEANPSASGWIATWIVRCAVPEWSIAWTLFISRLTITCWSWMRSPMIVGGGLAMSSESAICFDSKSWRTKETASAATAFRSSSARSGSARTAIRRMR